MKNLIFLVLILLIQPAISQINNPDIQTFSVKKIDYETDNEGVFVSFDLIMDNYLQDYFLNPYDILIKLTDETGKIVYKSKNGYEVKARQSYGKQIAEQKSIYFVISYASIDLSQGQHKINLSIFAKNKHKTFPVFYKKQIELDMPKLYDYYQQTFDISNFTVKKDDTKYGVKGIKINFNCDYKFGKNQIKGIEDNKDLAKYVFYVDLINTIDNYKIGLFNMPAKNKQEVEVLLKKGTYELFIPYNQINLLEGKYNIDVILNAKTYDEKYDFKALNKGNITIKQPKLYFLNFELKNCHIKQQVEYDVTSMVGRVFSSSAGRGYPDVYWMIKTGKLLKYKSEIVNNDFYALPGKAQIIISEDDPLYFYVMDSDFPSKDDVLGVMELENIPGEFSKKITSAHFIYVTAADFEYKKTDVVKNSK